MSGVELDEKDPKDYPSLYRMDGEAVSLQDRAAPPASAIPRASDGGKYVFWV